MKNRTNLRQVQRLGLTPSLRRSLDVLRMDQEELARLLETEAATNPWLRYAAPRSPQAANARLEDTTEAPAPGLFHHVLQAIEQAFPPGPARMLAIAFADALEPTGWLGQPLEVIARSQNASLDEAFAVLRRLWRIEPAGLFARNLAECLRLQAEDIGALSPALAAVLDRLPALAQGDLAAIARDSGIPAHEIASAARTLRGLDPKPGASFDFARTLVGSPELRIEQGPEGWTAALNPEALPQIALVDGPDAHGDPRSRAASDLVAMVQRRNLTLLAIARAVVAAQPEAFEATGPVLRPLRLATIAKMTGHSISTVSRALAGSRIMTPVGVWPMSAFFPSALQGGISSASARVLLQKVIAAENPAKPLSDAALAEEMARSGVSLSRRTVAKYRETLGLPPAHLRRRGRV